MLPTLRKLGIGLVDYSPLGRGFLSGRFRSAEDLDADDWREVGARQVEVDEDVVASSVGIHRDGAA